MKLLERVGLILFSIATFMGFSVAFFANGQSQWSYLALMTMPVTGIPGSVILMMSKRLRRPFLIFSVFGLGSAIISNIIKQIAS